MFLVSDFSIPHSLIWGVSGQLREKLVFPLDNCSYATIRNAQYSQEIVDTIPVLQTKIQQSNKDRSMKRKQNNTVPWKYHVLWNQTACASPVMIT